MPKTIYYVNTLGVNHHHTVINSSLLVICSLASEKVFYYGSKSNYESILKVTPDLPKNINVKFKYVVRGESKWSLMCRYVVAGLTEIDLCIRLPKDGTIFITNNNLFVLRIINYLNKYLQKSIIICCHAEMELVLDHQAKGGHLHQLLRYFATTFFLNPKIKIAKNIKFLVFGMSILGNAQKIFSKAISDSFFSLEHPYIFDALNEGLIKRQGDKLSNSIKFGLIGNQSKKKGLDTFFKIVSEVESKTYRNNFTFHIIGSIQSSMSNVASKSVFIDTNHKSMIDRKSYESAIESLDYVLFLYPQNSYKLAASGAILDAVKFEKPVIALRNDYFDYLFNKYGKFGYLANSEMEVISLIGRILNSLEDSKDFSPAYNLIKHQLSPKVLSDKFKNVIY